MTDLTEWIKERRRIHDAATEGPWAIDGPAQAGPDDSLVVYPKNGAGAIAYVQPAWDDADSIVDAHNTLPALLTAVEKVLELHEPMSVVTSFVPICSECEEIGGGDVPYPCETVQAFQTALLGEET